MIFLNNCWFMTIHFLGELGGERLKRCSHNIRRGGYLMMILDYKGGSGVKNLIKNWLRSKWMLLTMSLVNFDQSNLYFIYLKCFDFMWAHYNKDYHAHYLCNTFFQTYVIYFQEYLKFLMKWKWKQISLIIKFSQNYI